MEDREKLSITEFLISVVAWLVIFFWLGVLAATLAHADEGDICTSSSYCYCPDNRAPICIKDNVGTLGHCVCL